MFTCSPPPAKMLHRPNESLPLMETIGFRVVNCSHGLGEGVTDLGLMGTAIRIGSDVLVVFWDDGTIASYQCDGSLDLNNVPVATGIHFSIGYDDHPPPAVDDHCRDFTRPHRSCELMDQFIVQLGHSTDPTNQVCTGEVEPATRPNDDDTTAECKPGTGDRCAEEKKKCFKHSNDSEFLTRLPAYTRYSDLLMELQRHRSLETDKATATSLIFKSELKQDNHLIHPIILHDHNYI